MTSDVCIFTGQSHPKNPPPSRGHGVRYVSVYDLESAKRDNEMGMRCWRILTGFTVQMIEAPPCTST